MSLTRAQILAEIAANLPDNNSELITPSIHRETLGDVSGALWIYSNDAYIIVQTTDDPVANGTALQATYAAAKALTPNGGALSASNRATVVLPPGVYDVGTTPIAANTQFVDIAGLTEDPKSVVITSALTGINKGTVLQTANDIRFSSLTLKSTTARSANDATDIAAWWWSSSSNDTSFTDVIFDDNGGAAYGMRQSTEFRGTFVRCVAGDFSFGARSGATVKGDAAFTDCIAGNSSFGYAVEVAAVFNRCIAGSDSFGVDGFYGQIFDSRALGNSFGKGAFGGLAMNCVARGSESFGGNGQTCSGLVINCQGNAGSFGGVGGTFSGKAFNCFGGALSFGGSGTGTFSGQATNCVADGGSFGDGGAFSGMMTNCQLRTYTTNDNTGGTWNPWTNPWAPTAFSGVVRNAIFDPSGSNKDGIIVPNGATGEFEFCTFRKTGTGIPMNLASGSATINFSYCKFNTAEASAVAAGITNALGATFADAFNIGNTAV